MRAPPGPLAPESTAPQGLSLITRHPAHRSQPQSISSPPTPLYLTVTPSSRTGYLKWTLHPEVREAPGLRRGQKQLGWGQSKRAPCPLQHPLPTYQPKPLTFMVGGAVRKEGTAAGLGGSHPSCWPAPASCEENTEHTRGQKRAGACLHLPSPLSAAGLKDTG